VNQNLQKNRNTGRKPQIPHDLTRDGTRAAAHSSLVRRKWDLLAGPAGAIRFVGRRHVCLVFARPVAIPSLPRGLCAEIVVSALDHMLSRLLEESSVK
jgi:hypothetical protein